MWHQITHKFAAEYVAKITALRGMCDLCVIRWVMLDACTCRIKEPTRYHQQENNWESMSLYQEGYWHRFIRDPMNQKWLKTVCTVCCHYFLHSILKMTDDDDDCLMMFLSSQHHVDPAIGVYVIDRYTYHALEFLERVTPTSKKTMDEFVSTITMFTPLH